MTAHRHWVEFDLRHLRAGPHGRLGQGRQQPDRYGLSFAESLLPAARLRTYRKQLARVQDLLGEINDLAVARDYYQAALQAHPQAWFAVGWIGARLDGLTPQAQEAFDQLAHAKPFWK